MAITQGQGGKYNTGTVTNITLAQSSKTTDTGGVRPAKSDPETLIGAFPASPIHGTDADYLPEGTTGVVALRQKMQTMTVESTDTATVQGYWGFSDTESGPSTPSTGDLSFNGAPEVPSVTVDNAGGLIASPYMPNLVPPDSFSPTADNPTPVVIPIEGVNGPSLPPFIGNGTANPAVTSVKIHEGSISSGGEGPITYPEATPTAAVDPST